MSGSNSRIGLYFPNIEFNPHLQLEYSPWDWDQLGIKFATEYVIYQKLANFA